MAAAHCRWGILGTAFIARKNWQSIRKSGNGVLTAVASRSPERAEQFLSELQAVCPFPQRPAACTYDELIAREDVDAIYLPLPTGLRKEWVLRAARAGKHVLCEKPCAISSSDLQEMLDVCREHRVQFMDGVMFMHSDRLPALRQVLDDGTSIGPVRRIATQFSFDAPEEFHRDNIRVSSTLEPFGCLGDLGWYCIRFALWVMHGKLPREVTGRILAAHAGTDSSENVPIEFSAELLFEGNVSCSLYCSFVTKNQQWAHVSGARGSVWIDDFVLPRYDSQCGFETVQQSLNVFGCDFNVEHRARRVNVPEYSNSHESAQEVKMFRAFGERVLLEEPDPEWGEIAMRTQRVMEGCLESAKSGGRPVSFG